MHNEALADRLWQATGLHALFENLALGSARAVGLNPNLRFYKCEPELVSEICGASWLAN